MLNSNQNNEFFRVTDRIDSICSMQVHSWLEMMIIIDTTAPQWQKGNERRMEIYKKHKNHFTHDCVRQVCVECLIIIGQTHARAPQIR